MRARRVFRRHRAHIKRRRNFKRIRRAKPTYFPSAVGPVSKFTSRLYGECVLNWALGWGVDDNKFKVVEFKNLKPFKEDGICVEFLNNYRRIMINKILVVIDHLELVSSVCYGEVAKGTKPSKPDDFNVVNQDNARLWLRYRFVDSSIDDDVPLLMGKNSEAIGWKIVKPNRGVRIKKTFYPRCREYIPLNLKVFQSGLNTLLSQMKGRLISPRMLVGYGPYDGVHAKDSVNQLIYDCNFRLRVYTTCTFVGLRSDTKFSVNNAVVCPT